MEAKPFKFFNRNKRLDITPSEEKMIYLLAEDMKPIDIARRLELNPIHVNSTLKEARKRNKVKTNIGLVIRYILN